MFCINAECVYASVERGWEKRLPLFTQRTGVTQQHLDRAVAKNKPCLEAQRQPEHEPERPRARETQSTREIQERELKGRDTA